MAKCHATEHQLVATTCAAPRIHKQWRGAGHSRYATHINTRQPARQLLTLRNPQLRATHLQDKLGTAAQLSCMSGAVGPRVCMQRALNTMHAVAMHCYYCRCSTRSAGIQLAKEFNPRRCCTQPCLASSQSNAFMWTMAPCLGLPALHKPVSSSML